MSLASRTPLRVLIIDDHALVRAALATLVGQFADVSVVGELADPEPALANLSELAPDVILMDLALPGSCAFEAIKRFAALADGARVLVVSVHDTREFREYAADCGARGYVSKGCPADELERAIHAVALGGTWFGASPEDPAVAAGPPSLPRTKLPLATLTARQREVLRHIAEGHSTRQIAARLKISIKTVETHRQQIMERTGIKTVAGLVRYAIRAGLVNREG